MKPELCPLAWWVGVPADHMYERFEFHKTRITNNSLHKLFTCRRGAWAYKGSARNIAGEEHFQSENQTMFSSDFPLKDDLVEMGPTRALVW